MPLLDVQLGLNPDKDRQGTRQGALESPGSPLIREADCVITWRYIPSCCCRLVSSGPEPDCGRPALDARPDTTLSAAAADDLFPPASGIFCGVIWVRLAGTWRGMRIFAETAQVYNVCRTVEIRQDDFWDLSSKRSRVDGFRWFSSNYKLSWKFLIRKQQEHYL